MEQNYLNHHGIKGMKWGVRKRSKKLAPHEDYARVHDKKSVKQMSDRELRERNNRLQMEQQYNNLTNKKGRGKKLVQAYIATAGTIAGVAAATTTYKKYANKALDSIGTRIVKDIVIDNVH